MSAARTRSGAATARGPAPAAAASLGLPWRSPALLLVALAAAISIAVSVSYRIDDPDLWQHLAVGRATWQLHALPVAHQWTWRSWGTSDVNPSWGFEALLWPFWARGGLLGLFAWRWLTTLAAFALVGLTARRMGARALAPAFVLALCALTYRQRSDLRPETLSAVLFAATLWILETRRTGGPDRTWALVPIAWAWANTHLSYFLGLFVTAVYLVDRLAARRAAARSRAPDAAAPGAMRLALVLLASVAVSFANPFGWRALAQPFDYAFFERHEAVFRNIPELAAPRWSENWANGLPLLIAGWPILAVGRALRRGADRVELVLMALFTAQALTAQRFLGVYALTAAPFVSRDLSEWLAARGSPPRLPLAARAAGVAAACLAIGGLEWSRWDMPLALKLDDSSYPFRACDFMAAHDVRGRGMNQFGMAGWQVFRFWPDRGRLPFVDIHLPDSREDRDLYAAAQANRDGWARLDAAYRFDYALLIRMQFAGDRLLDALDADSAFALVFKDDAAALFVRRAGPMHGLAARAAYSVVPAGNAGLAALGAACGADTALRARARRELAREVAESPWHGEADQLLANLALIERDLPRARVLLDSVRVIDERRPRLYLTLGYLALDQRRPEEALRFFRRERLIQGESPALETGVGRAWSALGETGRARGAFQRALRRDPGNAEAADSLRAFAARRPA